MTLVGISSPEGASLLAALISPCKGLTGPLFSFPVFLHGQPLLVPENLGAPFICTGVLGLDEDNMDLPVSTIVVPVIAIGCKMDEC